MENDAAEEVAAQVDEGAGGSGSDGATKPPSFVLPPVNPLSPVVDVGVPFAV